MRREFALPALSCRLMRPAAQGLAQTGTTPGAGFFFLTSDFNPGATTPATNFRSYTSTLSAAGTNDNSSIAFTTSVPFVSASDLHLQSLSAPESAGTPIAAVTNDPANNKTARNIRRRYEVMRMNAID